jgi:acetylornithine deacetylase/succinyl-diaminopimelate desuccinylase-like protein
MSRLVRAAVVIALAAGPAAAFAQRGRAPNWPATDAEYCIAEGGNVARVGGAVRFATVSTGEKIPRGIELVAHGISGHGSIPLETNPVVHLARAVAAVATWQPPVTPNDATRAYFSRLATISAPDVARYYRGVLSDDPRVVAEADAWLRANEPRHASMLRTSVSPNIFTGGYRNNVIPSEARATLDVRLRPDENADAFRAEVERVVDDPSVEVVFNGFGGRPGAPVSRIDNEAFQVIEAAVKARYGVTTLPMMSTWATDMAFLRAKGVQCYGVGPAIDEEDGPKGFGAHSDQERLLEAELYRFVRFQYDIVANLAGKKR